MRPSVLILLPILLHPSAGASQGHRPAPVPDQVVAEIRAGYDSGFASLIAALPPSASDPSTALWPLWALGRFRTQAVAWATMSGDTYRALVPGPRMPAWLVVVPPGSNALRRMKGSLQLDPTATILVALIAPERVTPTWAGVFLVHQLSLLADYVHDSTSTSPSPAQYNRTELQAYDLELMAADFLSQGRLRHMIDSVLAHWTLASAEDAADRIAAADPSLLSTLQATVTAERPRSTVEAELRGGVAATSMVIRYCEVHALSADACGAVVRRFTHAVAP